MKFFDEWISLADIAESSPSYREIFSLSLRIAETQLSVFIWGEKGGAFFQIAKWIHERSSRKSYPLITFFPEEMSEEAQLKDLIGFSDGKKRYPGKLELATGGSLFIDGVEFLKPGVQFKLFHALNTREIEINNEGQSVKIDVRIMVGSRYSPLLLLESNLMRSDLLYRLEGIPIELIPLRERGIELKSLSERMIRILCHQLKVPTKSLSVDAIQTTFSYHWPMNELELFGTLEKAMLISDTDSIQAKHLFSPLTNQLISGLHKNHHSSDDLFIDGKLPTLDEVKFKLLKLALEQTQGDAEKAGSMLGISRATVFRMMKEMKDFKWQPK